MEFKRFDGVREEAVNPDDNVKSTEDDLFYSPCYTSAMTNTTTEPDKNAFAEQMLAFIEKSPCNFYAVKNLADELTSAGFSRLYENQAWPLERGKNYFVTRNSSSIISFKLPEKPFKGFLLCAAHSDSPCFKVKEGGCIAAEKRYVKLNVEKYGGMIMAPWFDRPLSVAGRLICKAQGRQDGGAGNAGNAVELEQRLVNIERDLVMIPNLAIHMSKDAPSANGFNVQENMLPILSADFNARGGLLHLAAENAGVAEDDVLSFDLYVYNRDKGTFWGAENEFIASPRLDDLECAFTTFKAFLDAQNDEYAVVHCVFDNEEVGSLTQQGADSTFLRDTLERLCASFNMGSGALNRLLADSFMVSADNAHAVHPNYAQVADPVNRPFVNGGPVIKFNAAQKYTSDAVSAALFKTACRNAGVPFQIFTNRSDMAGGSTLGNISARHVSIPSVDIGIAQWAMHSPFESAGAKDPELMRRAIKEYYEIHWRLYE